jgi:hypothetical protein
MQEQQVREQGGAEAGRRPLIAWAIIERKGSDRPFWNRVGSAFVNRDGSINVYLEALPLQGKVQLREEQPKDREGQRGPPGAHGPGEGGERTVRIEREPKGEGRSERRKGGDPFADGE